MLEERGIIFIDDVAWVKNSIGNQKVIDKNDNEFFTYAEYDEY